jgi:hypothetical protein
MLISYFHVYTALSQPREQANGSNARIGEQRTHDQNVDRKITTKCFKFYSDFLNVLDIVRDPEEEEEYLKRCRLASVLTLQWHLIGRIEEMMKLKVDRVGANHDHPGMGSIKIEWSNNITEER